MIDKIQIEKLYWGRRHTIEQVAAEMGIPFWTLYNFMNKYGIKRRNKSEVTYNYNRIKPQFEIKPYLSIEEEKLKIAGAMLYWAEGTLRGNTVDFTNSNPWMIQVFLKFLRQICGVSEDRLRVYLYVYPQHNLQKVKAYWQGITGIPLSQFTKPYVKSSSLILSDGRKLAYGLVHIRYNDKKLLTLISKWIEDYKVSSLLWVGTQVAKGDRLSKGSVLPKGRMEK